MNNSRNRSPLRICQFFSFYQFLRLLSKVDKDGLPELSSDTLSGIKRLIDEIRSFKCVFGRDSVMVLSWSGNCRRVNSILLIWLRPSTFFTTKKAGVCLVLVQRKTTRQYHWVVLTMNRSHRYFFEPYPIWFGTNFPFRPLEMSNSCYGVPLSNGNRRFPWKLSCMFSQALKNLWKSLKISDCTLCLWITLIHSDLLWTFRVIPEQRLSGPPLKQLWVAKQKAKKEQKRTKGTKQKNQQ